MASQMIGRYEVRAELGRGGMATVYRAYDPNFERDVAIKVLPEVFLHDPQFRVRFEREAKTIALLEHPAIVPVYDFGESGSQPYIVMRYMSGGTLSDRLKQGPMTLDETARLISRLSQALDAAHARGIIHRDIKPGNILFDQYGNAFLSDFGIAHLGVEGVTTMTGGGAIGTPAYMSPEQIQGDRKIDSRSDIYAIGVLVYQMLTGLMPYNADTPAKVMMMHVLQPVPQILEVRADLPIGCDAVIARAMAKNPDDRFSTAGELAEALDSTVRYSNPSASAAAPVFTPSTMSFDGKTAAALAVSAQAPTVKSASAVEAYIPTVAGTIPAKKGGSAGLWIGMIIGLVLVVSAVGLFLLGKSGKGPLAMLAPTTLTSLPPTTPSIPTTTIPLPTETPQIPTPSTVAEIIAAADTATPLILTPTLAPTSTVTPTQTSNSPVIGGADKIAYLDGNNIWIANLDGSDRIQLTTDGADKISLQWSKDGNSIYYITGKCIQSVNIETTAIDNINCFNFTDIFKSFQLSPDASKVAIGIDNRLYIVPFDIDVLRNIKGRADLTAMADCKDFAPFPGFFAESAQWSQDQKTLSVLLLANLGNGKRGSIIQVFNLEQCVPNPGKLDTFPGSTLKIDGYDQNPDLQNFGYDGISLYTMNYSGRNGGFGDLYAYNTELNKSYLKINPVNNRCCYRDSRFSPDGKYLLFAFQDVLQGANSKTTLYLVPYGQIGTGAQFAQLNLPEIQNATQKPQPILRPVK